MDSIVPEHVRASALSVAGLSKKSWAIYREGDQLKTAALSSLPSRANIIEIVHPTISFGQPDTLFGHKNCFLVKDGEVLDFDEELSADPNVYPIVSVRFQAWSQGAAAEKVGYMGLYDQECDIFYLCCEDDNLAYIDCRLYPQLTIGADDPYHKHLLALPWKLKSLTSSAPYNPLIHVRHQ